MSWQEELNRAVIEYVVTHGDLVKQDPGPYGWVQYSFDEPGPHDDITPALTLHMRQCSPDMTRSVWKDSDWDEFCGTFADPPWERRRGTDAVVWCTCGQAAGRHWRYTGTLADLIQAVTSLHGRREER